MLKSHLSNFFYHKEGRGKACAIDYYERDNKHYFFCYPEDYTRSDLDWQSGSLETLERKPAFELIFIYDKKLMHLDSYFEGDKRTDKAPKKIFCCYVLGFEDLPDKDDKVYNLEKLKDEEFTFDIAADSIIESAYIKSICP